VIGVCSVVCMRIALLRVGGYLTRTDISTKAVSWYSGLMLVAAFAWIVLGIIVGSWLAKTMLDS
jgi:multisubunit Na+/H+ antiporter MnhG subunit